MKKYLKMAKTSDRWSYSNTVNCMVLKFPPTIKTELEDKETGQESESRIMRSSKNQTDLVQTLRITKRPPSTEVSSTRSNFNIIIRIPARNNIHLSNLYRKSRSLI